MKIFKTIRETLFISSSTSISKSRKTQYQTVLWSIVIIHFLGLGIICYFAWSIKDQGNYIIVVSSLLECIGFISGLFLFILSLKSEVLVSQTYEFAAATAQASTHSFSDFKKHIEWLIEFLSPEKFNNSKTNLCLTVSTPIYGIGDSLESASMFTKYLESWVELYEMIKHPMGDKPNVELSIWTIEENIKTFKNNNDDWKKQETVELISRFANLLKRLKTLRDKNFINFNLFYTDRSDTRIFMAHAPSDRKYGGLLVLFSPLTVSSVKHKGWCLTGFSFNEEKGYENVYNFNYRLMYRDHEKSNRIDMVEELEDPIKWLKNHYGIE
ncbi:MAG: hypothetical protein HYZ42_11600 [Bacteroidetes bacterium]|nr:hypothetical protein [Bacteroidota bacterium]